MPDYTVKITYTIYVGVEAEDKFDAIEQVEAIEKSDGFELGDPEFEAEKTQELVPDFESQPN